MNKLIQYYAHELLTITHSYTRLSALSFILLTPFKYTHTHENTRYYRNFYKIGLVCIENSLLFLLLLFMLRCMYIYI